MNRLVHDVRFAWRLLLRQRASSGLAILTLALGIGATTAVFTVVYGVLLRPLPYRDPARLVQLLYGHQGQVSPWFSPLNFRDYVSQSDAFSAAAALSPTTINMTGSGDPERLRGARVSWNYFSVLGVSMAHGRGFIEADGQGTADRIVLSHGLWQRRFGGRPDVIDTTTTFDGRVVTIIGIAPRDLQFPAFAQFWQPLVFAPRDMEPKARSAQWVQVLARLRDTVSVEQATRNMHVVGTRLAMEFPDTETDATLIATSLHERVVGDIRRTLLLLLGAVTLLLLIACTNVAGLLLARTQTRGQEIAVRLALGASHRQLIGQLLVESLVIGLGGAVVGVGIAYALVRALVVFGPTSIPRLAGLTVDVNVLAFALGAAIVTSIVFGLAPAAWSFGWLNNRFAELKTRGAAAAGGTSTRRLLVICELAFAVVLLTAAGLLTRSYVALQDVDPGFDPEGVVAFNLSLPAAKYPDRINRGAFVSTLLPRLTEEAGVESASVAMGLPFTSDGNILTGFRRTDQPEPESAAMPSASLRIVSADYFAMMRIPLSRGRFFDQRDSAAGPEVALINEQTAQRYFAGLNPIGQQILVSAQLARQAPHGPKTIVGVVGNVKYRDLDEETPAEIYLPYDQQQVDAFTVVVRARVDPLAVIPSMRRDVASIDPLLPLANLAPLAALVDASIAGRRFTMFLVLTFAAVAVVLSVVGVYGVLACLVNQRTREIGVRLAVGASASSVVWLFVRESAVLASLGLAIGFMGALAAGRWMAALLFHVTPRDSATFAGVVFVLALAAVCATYLPARRAARVDPMVALRGE